MAPWFPVAPPLSPALNSPHLSNYSLQLALPHQCHFHSPSHGLALAPPITQQFPTHSTLIIIFAILVVTLLPYLFPSLSVTRRQDVLSHCLVPLAESVWLIIRTRFCVLSSGPVSSPTPAAQHFHRHCRPLPPGSPSSSLNFARLGLAWPDWTVNKYLPCELLSRATYIKVHKQNQGQVR